MRGMDCEVADFDDDGDLDIVVATTAVDPDRILINQGDFTFTEESDVRLPADYFDDGALTTGDIDGDGDVDIVVAVADVAPRLRCYENDGSGHFLNATERFFPAVDARIKDVVLADIDRDGDLDLIAVTAGEGHTPQPEIVLINTLDQPDSRPPVILDAVEHPPTSVTDRPYPITVIVSDNISLLPQAKIRWSVGEVWHDVPMSHIGGHVLRGFIPPQPLGSIINYRVLAADDAGNRRSWPRFGESEQLRVTAAPPLQVVVPGAPLLSAPGEILEISESITNRSGRELSVDAWAVIEDGQGLSRRVHAIDEIPIGPHSTRQTTVQYQLPVDLGRGDYAMRFVAGDYPLLWIDSQSVALELR
jgi:hypothetical protein